MMRPTGERGPIESTSRDLMARFDMAHDRKDRLPEVRKYLENLRPQILKLQRELRLQTEEDIAGLDRRDDLKMNDVDVLVDLIKAFRKAWNENRLSREQLEEVASIEAFKVAGAALERFGMIVEETVGGSAAFYESLAVVRATALAGEPRLAWKWYEYLRSSGPGGQRVEDAFWASPAKEIPTLLAIADGFRRFGERPPGSGRDWDGEVLRLVEDDDLWNLIATDDLAIRDRVTADVVRSLGGMHLLGYAARVSRKIVDPSCWLDAIEPLHAIYPGPGPIFVAVDRFATEQFPSATARVRIHFLCMLGRIDQALEEFGRHPYANGALGVMAAGLVRAGRDREAMDLLHRADFSGDFHRSVGRVAIAFLERNNLSDALRLLGEDPADNSFTADEAIALVTGLIRLGADKETILKVAEAQFPYLKLMATERQRVFRRIVPALFEAGIDASHLVNGLRAAHNAMDDVPAKSQLKNALLEIESGIALRTFKRAARLYREPGTSRSAEWSREAWEEKCAPIVKDWKESIVDQLTYDPPLS